MRRGEGVRSSMTRASAWLFLRRVTLARTRSPGTAPRTKTTNSSTRATPCPPSAGVVQGNEADAARRARIQGARLAATEEHLNPLLERHWRRCHDLAAELDY